MVKTRHQALVGIWLLHGCEYSYLLCRALGDHFVKLGLTRLKNGRDREEETEISEE
jgi:hypothetical protein